MKQVYTSLDIGTDTIKVVTCEFYKNKLNLLAASSSKSEGIKKGLIVDPAKAAVSIKEAIYEVETQLGIKIKKVIANVPSYFSEFSMINGEIEKLSCYKKEIDVKDIDLMVAKKIEDNVFEMIDAIFAKKLDKVFRIYYDLKINNNEPLTLISLIASQVRFLYQVMVLKDKGYSENNIANELSCHPYRAKLALEKVYHLNKMDLTNLLEELSSLDIKIKSGEIDRFVGFELFLLNACK